MVAFPLSGFAKWPNLSVLYTVRAPLIHRRKECAYSFFKAAPSKSIQFCIFAPLPTPFYTDINQSSISLSLLLQDVISYND